LCPDRHWEYPVFYQAIFSRNKDHNRAQLITPNRYRC
jgi:hypothetical protein